MNPLPSPYNFVPVTKHIYHPPWAAQVSHDVPFADGICGSFAITVKAVTPVFVRWNKENPHFYRACPNGPFAIPGTSLKGMIRAVVEIAAYGKLGRFVSSQRTYDKRTPPRIVTEDIKTKLGASFPQHIADWPPDLSETIFGLANGDDGLRSRVSFDTLVTDQATDEPEQQLTLLQPDVRCAPIYLEQEITNPSDGRVSPVGLLKFDAPGSRLRGWKRYPTRPLLNSDASSTPAHLKSKLRPLPKGTAFTGRVRVHNLRPAELGALVWALTWDRPNPLAAPATDDRCHTLGLAKPYGYGAVRIELSPASLSDLSRVDDTAVDFANCRNEFVATMEKFLPGWAESDPLRHLLAMADPTIEPPNELRYANPTELKEAKDKGYALLPYLRGFTPPQPHEDVRCVVQEGVNRAQCPRLQVEGDRDGITHGFLNTAPTPALAPGSVIKCRVTSVAPRSHAYMLSKPR
jgi:RAMP superfamily